MQKKEHARIDDLYEVLYQLKHFDERDAENYDALILYELKRRFDDHVDD